MNRSAGRGVRSRRQRSRAAVIVARLMRAAYHCLKTLWAAHRDHPRELSRLRALNDRELRDLGLTRADLAAIAKGTYHRD